MDDEKNTSDIDPKKPNKSKTLANLSLFSLENKEENISLGLKKLFSLNPKTAPKKSLDSDPTVNEPLPSQPTNDQPVKDFATTFKKEKPHVDQGADCPMDENFCFLRNAAEVTNFYAPFFEPVLLQGKNYQNFGVIVCFFPITEYSSDLSLLENRILFFSDLIEKYPVNLSTNEEYTQFWLDDSFPIWMNVEHESFGILFIGGESKFLHKKALAVTRKWQLHPFPLTMKELFCVQDLSWKLQYWEQNATSKLFTTNKLDPVFSMQAKVAEPVAEPLYQWLKKNYGNYLQFNVCRYASGNKTIQLEREGFLYSNDWSKLLSGINAIGHSLHSKMQQLTQSLLGWEKKADGWLALSGQLVELQLQIPINYFHWKQWYKTLEKKHLISFRDYKHQQRIVYIDPWSNRPVLMEYNNTKIAIALFDPALLMPVIRFICICDPYFVLETKKHAQSH